MASSELETVEEFPRRCEGGSTILPEGGREQDEERALRLVQALAPGTSDLRFFVIPGEPVSKARPRHGKGGTYQKTEDKEAEQRTGWHFRKAQRGAPPWTGNVALGCVFFRPNRQRIDVDNMLKHVCDSANGIAWLDDSQVTAVYGIAEFDAEYPRTVVVMGRHHSSLMRGTDAELVCPECGSRFMGYGTKRQRVHCSTACANKALGRRLSEPVDCKQCGKPFRRKTTAQVLCSEACRREHIKGIPRPKRAQRSRCETCDKELAHKRGGRCRDCWRADPRPQDQRREGAGR